MVGVVYNQDCRTGRPYVGFEVDRKYWETSQRRIALESAGTGQRTVDPEAWA